MNQGQATQPGTPSYCSTLTHTIYQTDHSINLKHQIKILFVWEAEAETKFLLKFCIFVDVVILDIKMIQQGFMRRYNLQWSVLGIPPCIDVALRTAFAFSFPLVKNLMRQRCHWQQNRFQMTTHRHPLTTSRARSAIVLSG